MGGIHHGVLFRRDDPNPAQGAAMIVSLYHYAAEALVPSSGAVVIRLYDFLHQRQMGFLLQQPAVVERLAVDDRLLPQLRRSFGREAGLLQQRFPQRLPPIPALHDPEHPFVQFCAQGVLAQVGDGGGVVDDRRGDGGARLGHKFPEWLPVETGEGEGDAAGLAQRDDLPPVEVEELVQFHQVAGGGDERRGDDSAVHQIQHRQQQKRLVRSLALGGIGPSRAGGAVERGESFDVGGKVGHSYLNQYDHYEYV